MRRPLTAHFIPIVLAIAVAIAGCGAPSPDSGGKEGGSASRRPARSTSVVVTSPRMESFSETIEAIGTLRANESVIVTAQVTEMVTRVNFTDGQVVAADDVLVELTSGEESAQLAEARANYDESLRQYRRVADLVRQGTDSQSRLDERVAARDAARARLEELKARMADRLIRAPFAGVLGLRSVSPGTLVRPGDQITTLDDIDVVKLDFSVPSTFLASLAAGQLIAATSASYADEVFRGRVQVVDTRIDPTTRAVQVRAILSNEDHRLRPGMLMAVELESDTRRSLALPEHALVPVAERQYVYVVDDDALARRVEVSIGRRRPGTVEVRAGLSGGETVVLDGADQLRPGSAVEIVERADIVEEPAPAGGADT